MIDDTRTHHWPGKDFPAKQGLFVWVFIFRVLGLVCSPGLGLVTQAGNNLVSGGSPVASLTRVQGRTTSSGESERI